MAGINIPLNMVITARTITTSNKVMACDGRDLVGMNIQADSSVYGISASVRMAAHGGFCDHRGQCIEVAIEKIGRKWNLPKAFTAETLGGSES